MNRLQHFLHAKTQFGLHSPFVYGLYTEVLFSRAEGVPRGRFNGVVWRLERHYGVETSRQEGTASLSTTDGDFLVVDHPHRNEALWKDLLDDSHYQVTLDLYSVGIAVSNPRLSRQHFLLR